MRGQRQRDGESQAEGGEAQMRGMRRVMLCSKAVAKSVCVFVLQFLIRCTPLD